MTSPVAPRRRSVLGWIALIPIAFTLLAFWICREFQDEALWISHTYEVRTAIRDIVMLAWNSERDLRNYLLTGQERYLQEMEAETHRTPERIRQLRTLTSDNPVQQRNITRFQPLVDAKLADLREILERRQRQSIKVPLTPAEIDHSQQLLEQIRDVSRDMMQEEERLLLAHSRVGSLLFKRAEITFSIAIVLTLLLLFWASRTARDYAAKRNRAELALQQKVSEIANLNRDLEVRVEQRTGALREATAKLESAYESSRFLASIVESSDDAIVGKSLDGVIGTWNAGAERLYGFRAEEIIGHKMSELVPPDHLHEEDDILDKIRRGGRVEHFETARLRKGGDLVYVSLTISPIRDESGFIVGASHVARDITAQKKSAELMLQSQKLESLGVLAGGIAHDFNNLLVGILGNASLVLEQLPEDSPSRTSVQGVMAAGERAASLTRQMLAYSGRGHFILERIDLSAYVRETLPLIEAAVARTVVLRLELADDLPMIEADSAQVQQIVMNLVINGAEAIPAGKPGSVTIATSTQKVDAGYIHEHAGSGTGTLHPGTYVMLEVLDTGSGMDEATRSRIFEPFFTTKFTGRGLGLAAVLGIVRGHSGFIQVTSIAGQGTTFRVLFPASTTAAERPRRSPSSQPELRDLAGHGAILVIDDELIVRKMAQQTLEHYGYHVLLAEDGARGVELFRRNLDRIQCVLLDMTMPMASGEEVLPRLKALRADIPVILSSGFSEMEALIRFKGQDLAGFIQKPYRAAILSQKIKEVIARCNPSASRPVNPTRTYK